MAEVYLYDSDTNDFSTIGIVGALIPTECTYKETANGNSTIHMVHPVDELGRYKEIKEDMILKVAVPVRTAPEIVSGVFISSVDVYTVKAGATKDQRSLYNHKDTSNKNAKVLKRIPVGSQINVIEKYSDDNYRWKCVYSYTEKKSKKSITGYIDHSQLRYSETRSISGNTGIETVAPSWSTKDQLFRIYNVEKDIDSVSIDAQHISYDLMYNLTGYDVNGSAAPQTVLDNVLSQCYESHDFTAKTNLIGDKAGFHYADKDPITAILDPDIGICARWRGQLIRDNYSLYILDQAGVNRGMRFEYGKNISGVTYTLDNSNQATALRPFGEDEKGRRLYLDRSYVCNATYTELVEVEDDTLGLVYMHGYKDKPYQRIYALECSDCTVNTKNGVTAAVVRARMRDQSLENMAAGAYKPSVSVSVDMVELGRSSQFADYADLLRVFLFDTIGVRHTAMGIDIESTVCEIEWDCILDSLSRFTLGIIMDQTASVASWQIQSVDSTKLISSASGTSAVIAYSLTENALNQASNASESAILAALQDPESNIYKAVEAIAKG